MACNYYLKKGVSTGMTPIFIRIRSRKMNVDIKLSTEVEVDANKWINANSSPKAYAKFRKAPTSADLFSKLDLIESKIESLLSAKVAVTSDQAKAVIDDVAAGRTDDIRLTDEIVIKAANDQKIKTV